MRKIVITQVKKRSVKVNSGAKYAKHIETMAKIIHVIVNLLNISLGIIFSQKLLLAYNIQFS